MTDPAHSGPLRIVLPHPQRLRGSQATGWMRSPPRAVPGAGLICRWKQEPRGDRSPSSAGATSGERDEGGEDRAPRRRLPCSPRSVLQRPRRRRECAQGAGRTAPPRQPGLRLGRPPATALGPAARCGWRGGQPAQRLTCGYPSRGQRQEAGEPEDVAEAWPESRGHGGTRSGRSAERTQLNSAHAAARAVPGGADAAPARPRLGTLCRCASPLPTARRADPGPRQPRRVLPAGPLPASLLESAPPPLSSPHCSPPLSAILPSLPSPAPRSSSPRPLPASPPAGSDSASLEARTPLQSRAQAPLGSSPGAICLLDAHDSEMRLSIHTECPPLPGAGQSA